MSTCAVAGSKRKHECSSDDSSMKGTADNATADNAGTAANAGAAGTAAPSVKRARLDLVPFTAEDAAHFEAQRKAYEESMAAAASVSAVDAAASGSAAPAVPRGARLHPRILVESEVEVEPSGHLLVHMSVCADGPSHRAAKRASRAAAVAVKHRDKKVQQKANKKAAKAVAAAQKAEEVERMRQAGATNDDIQAHLRGHAQAVAPAAPGTVSVRHTQGTRAAQAHRTRLMERMRAGELQRVLIDCSFDSLMTLNEVCSLAKQIKYIYGHNIRSAHPLHIVITGLTQPPPDFDAGQGWKTPAPNGSEAAAAAATSSTAASSTDATVSPAPAVTSSSPVVCAAAVAAAPACPAASPPVMYTRALLNRLDGFDRLALDRTERAYTDLDDTGVARSSLVYLTAESDTVLDKLDPTKAYVVGGLVDHNRLRGLCHRLAGEQQLPTARLPIQEHLAHNGRRTVITVNQVVEILLRANEWQQQHGTIDWAAVMQRVLPARSNWQAKSSTTADATSDALAGDAASADAAAAALAEQEQASRDEQADDERNQQQLGEDAIEQ